jgi:hypothetical protein
MIDTILRQLQAAAASDGPPEPLKAPRAYTEKQARTFLARHKAQSIPINRASMLHELFWDIDDDRIIGTVELIVEKLDVTFMLFTKQGTDRWFGYAGVTTVGAANIGAILDNVEPLAESARQELSRGAVEDEG